VYGIGVRYDDAATLQRLFDLKERADRKPVLLLLPRAEDLQRISRDVPPEAEVVTDVRYLGTVTGESFFYAARRLEVMIGTALIRRKP
jgi:tRNA A37 threonylcarbamoyladenosine synthetase subunit TsaC/SUA5/YrdC